MWQPWAGSLANVIGLCTFFSAQTCAFSSTACTNGCEVFMGHRETIKRCKSGKTGSGVDAVPSVA